MIKRVIAYVALGGVILTGYYLLFRRPIDREIEQLDHEVKAAEAKLDDYTQTLAHLPEYLDEAEELSIRTASVNSTLYAKSNILTLLDHLHDLAKERRMVITEITPPVHELLQLNEDAQIDNAPLFLNLSLVMRGDYTNFGRFVASLENRPYFREINFCQILGNRIEAEPVTFAVGFRALLSLPELKS